MNKKIYAIVGLSGSGKSTVASELSKLLGIPKITTVTTRPMRPFESNGKDYYFFSKERFDILIEENYLIAREDFKVANSDIWSYAIRKKDLDSCEKCVIVVTPQGVMDLKVLGYNVISFYIDVNEEERLYRIYGRKDNQGDAEIQRRNRDDKEKFKDFIPDYILNNNNDIDETIKQFLHCFI